MCCVVADAARIQEHSAGNLHTESDLKWYRSCETLQNRFVTKSQRLQDFLETTNDSEAITLRSQAQLMVKASAVLRTLRRSKECPWIVSGSGDEVQAVGKVVSIVLAKNPCAKTAMAELRRVDVGGEEGSGDASPLARAMSILISDTCEVPHVEDANDFEQLADLDDLENEELVMDGAEEMAAAEPESVSDSLLENPENHTAKTPLTWKLMGAIFLGLLFVLQCANTAFWIVGFVGMAFTLSLYGLAAYTPYMMQAWRNSGHLALLGGGGAYVLVTLVSAAAAWGGGLLCASGYDSVMNSTLGIDNGNGVGILEGTVGSVR